MSFTGINKLLKLVCRKREREVNICRVENAILGSTCKKYIHANQSCYPIKIVVTSSAYFHCDVLYHAEIVFPPCSAEESRANKREECLHLAAPQRLATYVTRLAQQ
jgi:hypothetical protein